MGQDYTARKAAKKGRKRLARDGAAKDAEGGRARKKKNAPRRLCRGPCYSAPVITDEDREWDGREDGAGFGSDDFDAAAGGGGAGDEDAAARAAARAKAARATAAAAGYDSDSDAEPGGGGAGFGALRPERAAAAAAGGKVAMTTSVRLLDAAALAQNDAAAAAQAAAAARAGADGAKKKKQKKDDGDGDKQQQQEKEPQPPVEVPEALREFPELVGACMASLGFAEPTPVQAAAWRAACTAAAAGKPPRDVAAVAEPGSGKTLAYLLPALMRARERMDADVGADAEAAEGAAAAPLALVLAPTRELALQVAQQARALRRASRAAVAAVYGGAERAAQVAALARRPPVVVATPGRLLDLVDAGHLDLSAVRCVVLDEADKMLGLGFAPQLERLRAMLLPPAPAAEGKAKGQKEKEQQKQRGARPQVLLFTATMPAAVDAAAAAWLAPGAARVRTAPSAESISRTVAQVVHVCAEHKKPAKLLKHLAAVRASAAGARNPPRVLVFANRVKAVKFLVGAVRKDGWRADCLHGKRPQAEREAAIAAFRAGKVQVLVASDVAARGLDVRGLPYVVNYDFPARLETYVHRVGRTGRLAANGHAYSFFTRNLVRSGFVLGGGVVCQREGLPLRFGCLCTCAAPPDAQPVPNTSC